MLQVDPAKRIRIDDLLRHRWLINNVYPEPIKWESIYHVNYPDSIFDFYTFEIFVFRINWIFHVYVKWLFILLELLMILLKNYLV